MLQECCLVALQHSQDSVCATGSTPGNLSCYLSTMLQECCLLALQQMIFIANRVLPSLDKCRLIMAFFGPIWPSLVQFGLLCTNLGKFWPYFNSKRNRIDLFDLFLCKFWPKLEYFETFGLILAFFDQIGQILGHIWHFLSNFPKHIAYCDFHFLSKCLKHIAY